VARVLHAGGDPPQVLRRVLVACYLDRCRDRPASRIGFSIRASDHGCAVLGIGPHQSFFVRVGISHLHYAFKSLAYSMINLRRFC
jgi:hypothetical protein